MDRIRQTPLDRNRNFWAFGSCINRVHVHKVHNRTRKRMANECASVKDTAAMMIYYTRKDPVCAFLSLFGTALMPILEMGYLVLSTYAGVFFSPSIHSI